jgi:hypothetical protein
LEQQRNQNAGMNQRVSEPQCPSRLLF